MNYIDINKDIINLILNSNEKFFVLIGENSSGKSEILEKLNNLGLKTIDNFRYWDEEAIKQIEEALENEEKIIIATHYIHEMFGVLSFVPSTSIIIGTFINDIYNLASWGDMNQNFICNLIRHWDNELEQLLQKLLSIALFNNWSITSQKYLDTIDMNTLSPSQKIIYDIISKYIKN